MDKLLDMSASTLRKSDDIINIGVKKVSFLVCHLVLLMSAVKLDSSLTSEQLFDDSDLSQAICFLATLLKENEIAFSQ